MSENNIGQLLPPEGWVVASHRELGGPRGFTSPEGEWQAEAPSGSAPAGVIALAEALKNHGALAKLDLSRNSILPEQIAELKGICEPKAIALNLEDQRWDPFGRASWMGSVSGRASTDSVESGRRVSEI